MNVDFIHSQQNLSETQRLASLGKIYGFLKYYHPEVAKGKFNWDQEFLEKMPQVMNATNKVSLSKVYLNWINGLGTIKKCRRCDANENHFNKNFDLSWTQDTTLFTNELASKLKYIEKNRNQQKNFYVTNERVGKIKVTNEPTYNDFEFPDEEYRLLGLFKYWNIIEYFYPYKYLTDQPWDEVLLEMIPKYRKTSNKKDYHLTIAELIAKLDDTHARIGLSAKRSKYLPVKISHIENKAVISGFYNDSIAQQNNLKLGDIILKINDVEVQAEVEENLKYVAGSNKNGKIKNTYNRIFNGIEKSVELTIKRNDEIEDLRVNRYDFNDFNYGKDSIDIKSKSINNQVGYINMGTLKFEDVADVFESFENKKSIIIDLRNYPDFIYKYVTRFLNTEKKDFSKLYTPDINYPSRFTFKDNLKTLRSRKAFEGKIILVVNEETVSRAEFTAMAFQTAENVITVGNQTAGADGDVVVFEYLGGYKTSMSGNGISYPNGMETQRKGIRIDIKVTPTINGLRQGRDEVLEKALEIANQ
ncbi:S41 family peptidase [Mesonia maritima]|uniref:C-terminal processing protease CtpA/Prc n=1 Tax=Mesonia maritima TaxID=1793873 RepID=A0ABU1K3D6_9FLAO|nr:S41 family peptidase [Mesonia maritima]MDR6300134.1 C-terminal processing protease CtpA/Prc [Mesonia maritima]